MAELVSKSWFLIWNCLFMAWIRQRVDFWIRSCVGVKSDGSKLRLKEITSNSGGDG